MANTKQWPDPDTQFNESGREDVYGVYLLSPSAQKPVEPGGGSSSGFIALTGNAQTTAGSETVYTFAQQVSHYRIQNNTSANLTFKEDAAASAGSAVLVPMATYREDKPVTTIHLFTAAAQRVNGTSAGNIVIEGWL